MSEPVVCKRVEVQGKEGLHLRSASLFVELAKRFECAIRVRRADQTANGRSIMDLLTLATEAGNELILEAEGKDALQAVEALTALIANDFQSSAEVPPPPWGRGDEPGAGDPVHPTT